MSFCTKCRGSHEDYLCTQLWCENGDPICETCGENHMDYECLELLPQFLKDGLQRAKDLGNEIDRQNEELIHQNNEFKQMMIEQSISNQKFLEIFKECFDVMNKKREDEERIINEKKAEELEAERKKQECLKIDNSLPKTSTRSRRSRFDSSLSGFKVSYKGIPLSKTQSNPLESVSSLKIGDKRLNTQEDSPESSVKNPISIPRELDDEEYKKRFDLLTQNLFSHSSIYANVSKGYLGSMELKESNIPLREEIPRYYYDGALDKGEDIIPLMMISRETGLPEKIIDKSLSDSFVSKMNVLPTNPITPDIPVLETVDSLKMVDEQCNTTPSTESANEREPSVDILTPIPSESGGEKKNVLSKNEDSMESHFKVFENMLFDNNNDFSSNGESSSKVEIQVDTFKCFSNPLYELDEEVIILEKNFSKKENDVNDDSEGDFNFFESLLKDDTLPPEISNVEPGFQHTMEEIDIFFDDGLIPPGIDTDDDSEGDVPPFEKPLDDGLFPLPKSDVLPTNVEPVEVLINDFDTNGENTNDLSQVETEFLSMIDELFNLDNDGEIFDPGGGTNDVLLNNRENNDLDTFTIRTFLPFVTYPADLPLSYSTGSEDTIFEPGILNEKSKQVFKDKSPIEIFSSLLTLNIFDSTVPTFTHTNSLVWGRNRPTDLLHPHFYPP
ncbi:hypothetical protein Tco_0675444 [Tanacetum coccineum]